MSAAADKKTRQKFVMGDATTRKRASVIVYANIPNLTKKMLHKSLEMSTATVCWVKQFNATGPVTPKEKENVAEKGFSSLGIDLEL